MVVKERKEETLGSWMKNQRTLLDFIQRDMLELGLDDSCTISILSVEEIEGNLGDEFPSYNSDITECTTNPNNIIVISGYSSIEEHNVKLYYYEQNTYNKDGEMTVTRQLREYDDGNELQKIERVMLDSNGKYSELDDGVVKYVCDEYGIKEYARIDDPFTGTIYFIYDEKEKVEFKITDEYVDQLIKNGDKEYHIIDGYIEPRPRNEEALFSYLPPKTVIEPGDIKRVVYGDISEEEKDLIIGDFNQSRQEQISNVLQQLVAELNWMTQTVKFEDLEEMEDLQNPEELGEEFQWPEPEENVEEDINACIGQLRKSVEQYKVLTLLEKYKQEVTGGNEFLEKILKYVTQKKELTAKNKQARDLLKDYEQQADKDGQTQSDEN